MTLNPRKVSFSQGVATCVNLLIAAVRCVAGVKHQVMINTIIICKYWEFCFRLQ